MHVEYATKALLDLEHWKKNNPKVVHRIKELIANIQESPYTGLGRVIN